jgi:hypothetical protein
MNPSVRTQGSLRPSPFGSTNPVLRMELAFGFPDFSSAGGWRQNGGEVSIPIKDDGQLLVLEIR